MMDPFIAERFSEEKEQRELLKQRGVFLDLLAPPPTLIDNPDLKITRSAGQSEVYKFAEMELLKLKMKLNQNRDLKESEQDQLAGLIKVLISEGSDS